MHREASAAGRIRPDNTVTTLDKKQGRHFCRPYAYCLLVFDAVYCRGSSGVCGRSGSTETASDAVISSYRLLSRRLMPPSPLPEVPELVRSMSPHIAMSQSVLPIGHRLRYHFWPKIQPQYCSREIYTSIPYRISPKRSVRYRLQVRLIHCFHRCCRRPGLLCLPGRRLSV